MNCKIIYEDNDYIVIHKPAGLATQTAKIGQTDVLSEIKNYLSQKYKNPYLAVINRLDQPVEGLVLLAKNDKTAAALSKQLTEGKIEKYYHATVYGHLSENKGKLEDYLVKDAKTNMSKVSDKGNRQAKKAILEYEVIASDDSTDTVNIHLITGRHHQIRVQFANAGCPLTGDSKYGSKDSVEFSKKKGIRNVSLISYCLSFENPQSKEPVKYSL